MHRDSKKCSGLMHVIDSPTDKTHEKGNQTWARSLLLLVHMQVCLAISPNHWPFTKRRKKKKHKEKNEKNPTHLSSWNLMNVGSHEILWQLTSDRTQVASPRNSCSFNFSIWKSQLSVSWELGLDITKTEYGNINIDKQRKHPRLNLQWYQPST